MTWLASAYADGYRLCGTRRLSRMMLVEVLHSVLIVPESTGA